MDGYWTNGSSCPCLTRREYFNRACEWTTADRMKDAALPEPEVVRLHGDRHLPLLVDNDKISLRPRLHEARLHRASLDGEVRLPLRPWWLRLHVLELGFANGGRLLPITSSRDGRVRCSRVGGRHCTRHGPRDSRSAHYASMADLPASPLRHSGLLPCLPREAFLVLSIRLIPPHDSGDRAGHVGV